MGPKENNRPVAKKAEKFVSRFGVSVCVFLMSPYDTAVPECSGADFRAKRAAREMETS